MEPSCAIALADSIEQDDRRLTDLAVMFADGQIGRAEWMAAPAARFVMRARLATGRQSDHAQARYRRQTHSELHLLGLDVR
ncbi:MAG: hypothetical protein BGO38_10270 [Cellulomonas sp. 73-145]|nr:MAG: hypothetical protein BGO38_10270 [Cellulomonas sp. 73-145]